MFFLIHPAAYNILCSLIDKNSSSFDQWPPSREETYIGNYWANLSKLNNWSVLKIIRIYLVGGRLSFSWFDGTKCLPTRLNGADFARDLAKWKNEKRKKNIISIYLKYKWQKCSMLLLGILDSMTLFLELTRAWRNFSLEGRSQFLQLVCQNGNLIEGTFESSFLFVFYLI